MTIKALGVNYALPVQTVFPDAPPAGRVIGPIPMADGYFMRTPTKLLKIGPPHYYNVALGAPTLDANTINTVNTWTVLHTGTDFLDANFRAGDWFVYGAVTIKHTVSAGRAQARMTLTGANPMVLRTLTYQAHRDSPAQNKATFAWAQVIPFANDGASTFTLEWRNLTAGTFTLSNFRVIISQLSQV